MVQVDVPMAFAIGGFFVDAAHKQLQHGRPEYYYRAFSQNNIYQIFFFSWIPLYFLMNYFGWETTHMWWHEDSVAAYPYFVPIFIVIFFLAANGGFLLGYQLVKRGRLWANRAIYLSILGFCSIWLFGQVNRSWRLGTYQEWITGQAPWFYQDRNFLFMLIFTLLVWGIPMPIYLWRLWREGKHLDPPLSSR